MTSEEMRYQVDKMISEGYRLWKESGIPFPSVAERYIAADELLFIYDGPNAAELATACQCFYYFRKFHNMVAEYPKWSTLMGDYFFSQFSRYLIPLDSIPLTDAFSAYLKKDIALPTDVREYIKFIRGLPVVLL